MFSTFEDGVCMIHTYHAVLNKSAQLRVEHSAQTTFRLLPDQGYPMPEQTKAKETNGFNFNTHRFTKEKYFYLKIKWCIISSRSQLVTFALVCPT
jgi:hypothetical protein